MGEPANLKGRGSCVTDKEILDMLEKRLSDDAVYYDRVCWRGISHEHFAKRTYAKELCETIRALRAEDENEPKGCPFSGKKPLVHSNGNMYEVRCENDDCKIAPSSYRYSTREEAVDAWNERG